MKNIKWCCPAFAGWYDEAGKRGVAIIIERYSDNEPRFLFQYRAVDMGLESEIYSKSSVTISPIAQVGIQHCPWCGCKLDKWYNKYLDDLVRKGFAISLV
jgi:hypothetical protein